MSLLTSLTRVASRAAFLLLDTEVEGAEAVAVMAVSTTGLILSLPRGTLDSLVLSRHLEAFAPEWAWALAADALSVWQILGLLVHRRSWRRWGLQAAAGWWMCLATFLFLAGANGLVWSHCAIFCAASCRAYWRIRQEERLQAELQWDARPVPGQRPGAGPGGAGRLHD